MISNYNTTLNIFETRSCHLLERAFKVIKPKPNTPSFHIPPVLLIVFAFRVVYQLSNSQGPWILDQQPAASHRQSQPQNSHNLASCIKNLFHKITVKISSKWWILETYFLLSLLKRLVEQGRLISTNGLVTRKYTDTHSKILKIIRFFLCKSSML